MLTGTTGRLKAGEWNHLKAHSLTCLVLDAGVTTSGFSMWHGLLPNMVAMLQG